MTNRKLHAERGDAPALEVYVTTRGDTDLGLRVGDSLLVYRRTGRVALSRTMKFTPEYLEHLLGTDLLKRDEAPGLTCTMRAAA